MQGKNKIFFSGAWTGYGFHEDGVNSALQISKLLKTTPLFLNQFMKKIKNDNFFLYKGNIFHKSGQFFSIEGVRTTAAANREVAFSTNQAEIMKLAIPLSEINTNELIN